MFWAKKKRKGSDERFEHLMAESQRALLHAATSTADAAKDVTTRLKARLDDSIRQFENTARIMNDALFMTTMDGQIQSFNPAAGRMFGRNELAGRAIADLFREGDNAILDSAYLWRTFENASTWLPNSPTPLRGHRPSGTLFWIEPSITRLDWSNGTSSMLIIIRDMSPVVGLSESARQSRQQYKSLFDASYDGILIEQNDIIVAANPSITRLFGYDVADLLRRPVAVLFSPLDHDRVEANEAHVHLTAEAIMADGARASVAFTATQFTWNNKPARLITIKDTTGTKQVEEIVQRRDNGMDMICCFDLNFRITFTNASFAGHYGYSRTELLNRDVRHLMGEHECAAFLANMDSITPTLSSIRMQVQASDGQITDWIDHAVFDDAGNPIEFQRVGRDLSSVMATLAR